MPTFCLGNKKIPNLNCIHSSWAHFPSYKWMIKMHGKCVSAESYYIACSAFKPQSLPNAFFNIFSFLPQIARWMPEWLYWDLWWATQIFSSAWKNLFWFSSHVHFIFKLHVCQVLQWFQIFQWKFSGSVSLLFSRPEHQ